ncbi:hypothetical protein QBC36DRAFT_295485 [Triangularia setosa]|uniref:Uncharacterized protein n=1 Tax=Triangularia setosa TaxID=2587417 RepID=A0AAN7A273_9PEZI|nr:hypothetical protein QBC36DRAFT_295485 [Podospora setosa]
MLLTILALFLSSISIVGAGRAWVTTKKDYGNATFSGDLADVSIAYVPGGGYTDGDMYGVDDFTETVTQGTTTTYTTTFAVFTLTSVSTATETLRCPEHNSNSTPHWVIDLFSDKYCPGNTYPTISLLKYGTMCVKTPDGTEGARIRDCMMDGCSTTLFKDENCNVGPTRIENAMDCLRLDSEFEIKSLVVAR